jgi:preprotein translocase subunit SecA
MIVGMIDGQVKEAVARYTDDRYGPASFAQYASGELGVEFDPSDFRGCGPDEAIALALDRAANAAPIFIQEAIDENLNPNEDAKDWKWQELCRAMNVRFGLTTDPAGLKKVGRDELSEHLIPLARQGVEKTDLSGGARFLDRTYPLESLTDWARQKFGLRITLDEVADKEPGEVTEIVRRKVRDAYRRKDLEFPVAVGLASYLPEKMRPDRRPDRDTLFRWATERFAASGVAIPEDVVRTEPRAKVKEVVLKASEAALPAADYPEITAKVADAFRGTKTADADDAKELADWCQAELRLDLNPAVFTGKTEEDARDVLLNAYDAKYRPEMHQTERSLVLEQVDATWKSHLLGMDHLRHSVSLRGYAQEDPKIAYKREGMKKFDDMWQGIHERVSEGVFRMEDVSDEEVNAAMWAGAQSTRGQGQTAMQAQAAESAMRQQAAMSTNSGGAAEKKIETIRNIGAKVGRNDPCPCGSGKKYKNCHMKTGGA